MRAQSAHIQSASLDGGLPDAGTEAAQCQGPRQEKKQEGVDPAYGSKSDGPAYGSKSDGVMSRMVFGIPPAKEIPNTAKSD